MPRIRKYLLIIILILKTQLSAQLLINELVTETTSDWVELTLASPTQQSMDISGLYVTMYYGTNEPLAAEPVTIYSYDRAETPYDDRYVVVHLTKPDIPDETDRTGDTNGNGYIDIYCNNYFGSLWNTDGVVAIDSDDDPANGGIIDFVFYSNRDGSPSEAILAYVTGAQSYGQWRGFSGESPQECAAFIGKKGLPSYMSLSRKNRADTNSADDVAVTNIQTPGAPNITAPLFMGNRLFKPLRKKITIIPGHCLFGSGCIPVFVFAPCVIKLRIFTVTGIAIHESPLFPSVNPGLCTLFWNPLLQHRRPPTGLYLCKIEAVNPSLRLAEEEIIYILLSHYR
ncbi:MAG: hypothetical protein A2176_05180 [Spirochaetes bacterium RBG_13_51_14]|nr:MAG: hypothetical protein A2176_05180 [Spirochaetes bacterium RBG_13_51_14]